MAEALVGGAALGFAFERLYEAVNKALRINSKFHSEFDVLQRNLKSTNPFIDRLKSQSGYLLNQEQEAAVNELEEMMDDGTALIEKCSKVTWWNLCWNRKMGKRLNELNARIEKFTLLDVNLLTFEAVVQVLREVRNLRLDPDDRTDDPKIIPRSPQNPPAPEYVVGLETAFQNLRKELLDQEGVSVRVISAPPGYGKTTLARKLIHDSKIKGHFKKNIVFVRISKANNLKIIVKKILQHTKAPVPEFQSDEDAMDELRQLLSKKSPILLVLDDLWSEDLLKKFQFDIPEYKILVTSRSELRRFGCTYRLMEMNNEDAMRLFRHSAGLKDGNTDIPENLLKKIVEGCKGSPLALTIVGGSLCDQPLAVWKDREQEWSKGESIFSSNSSIFDCLQTSLDALDDKDRQCFLDLGSFPEGQRIPANALIDMWAESYDLGEDGAMSKIHRLCQRNLAGPVIIRRKMNKVDSCYDGCFLAQHDLLTELAIFQSSKENVEQRKRLIVNLSSENILKWWKDQKLIQANNARLLSISTDETFSSNWPDICAPEVEVLVLNMWSNNYSFPTSMKKMAKLKVLIVTNYGFYPAEFSNFELIASLSTLRRIRLEHVFTPCLGKPTLQLLHLKKITLVMCKIGQAFKNCDTSVSHVFPNLVEINIDYCDDLVELPDDLCHLIHLKTLSITNCHNLSLLPEGLGKLASMEVLRLFSCTSLSKLPDKIGGLRQLKLLDVSDCVELRGLPDEVRELQNLRTLDMRNCLGFRKLPKTMKKMQLEDVTVICDEERAYLWKAFTRKPKIEIVKEEASLSFL